MNNYVILELTELSAKLDGAGQQIINISEQDKCLLKQCIIINNEIGLALGKVLDLKKSLKNDRRT